MGRTWDLYSERSEIDKEIPSLVRKYLYWNYISVIHSFFTRSSRFILL